MLKQSADLITISPEDYREAMSHFAGAVHVVTTDGRAGRRGVTVSAAISASDDPPTVIACLNRNRAENRWFEANECFAVNTLCKRQVELARAFAGEGHLSMDARFEMGEWTTLNTKAPILSGSRMAIDCVVRDIQTVYTHFVIFGNVVACGELRREPALVYLDRGYRSL